jgi:phosphatidylglycerophosphate synthase
MLTRPESVALRRLAQAMPDYINSDHLTLLGLAGMLLAGVFYYLSQWHWWMLHLVNLALVLNWFGDSLDGTLARFRGKTRPRYGYYIDHVLDNFGALLIATGLALAGLMSTTIALVFLTTYLLLNINIYLATSTLGVFKISYGKLGPTELRLVLIIGNLFLINHSEVSLFGHTLFLYDIGALVGVSVMAVILVAATLRNTRALYRMERL